MDNPKGKSIKIETRNVTIWPINSLTYLTYLKEIFKMDTIQLRKNEEYRLIMYFSRKAGELGRESL